MSQSVYDDPDDCDYNSDPDSDIVPNYLSDDPDIDDFEDNEVPNTNSRPEPTFNPEGTSVLSSQDVVNAIELDPSLLSYGTNFNKLLAQDTVHVHIMRLVERYARDPKIPVDAKVNFVKLAAINKAKASNIQDFELASMMEAVTLAQRNNKERRNAINEHEKVVRDCIDQIHWLNNKKNSHLQNKVAATFRVSSNRLDMRFLTP
jgi:hypothetical protein